MIGVLFVCLGNICRSPTAHGVFETMVHKAGLEQSVFIESAGTSAYHIGEKPDQRSASTAAQRGYHLDHIRAQQVQASDFEKYDYLMAMDQANFSELQKMCPQGCQDKVALFLDYGSLADTEVPDPYYGGEKGFDHVLDLVENASEGLLSHISSQL